MAAPRTMSSPAPPTAWAERLRTGSPPTVPELEATYSAVSTSTEPVGSASLRA